MKIGLLLIITAAITSLAIYHLNAEPKDDLFEKWVEISKITFETPAQKFYRRTIFYRNYQKINQHNLKSGQTYKMGVNQFTMYSEEEFVERFLNSKIVRIDPSVSGKGKEGEVKAVTVDWVERGAVSPVKNQGTCGSGVLFSTLGGMQGLSKVSTGTLQTFSEQQLIDCVFGCTGSQASVAYNYYKTHGACTPSEYPNTGKVDTCQTKSCAFKISDVKTVNTCDALATAINIEPISVTVDASRWSPYSSGIFSNCGTSLNHMVLLVTMDDQYWRCKNSWGTAWGQKGYIRLARGNTCGICQYGSYPIK